MNISAVTQLLQSPNEETTRALLEDDRTVFWVDWHQEDESIPASCEAVLQTGSLHGELVKVESNQGYEVWIGYKGRKIKVPLTYSCEDRNVTLASLNKILSPDFEIRFCHGSSGSDTLAFLALSSAQWRDLEKTFGAVVGEHFFSLADYPSLF